ncbi:leucyl aminopeptidase family protein [bacterium]|nr:leucyl aminopeptidase family protein [bacterium]
MTLGIEASNAAATRLALVTREGVDAFLKSVDPALQGQVSAHVAASGFKGEPGRVLIVPDASGGVALAIAGAGDGEDPFVCAPLPSALPGGAYRLDVSPPRLTEPLCAIAWSDGAYRFNRYRREIDTPARLVIAPGEGGAETLRIAAATDWLRDLVNTPARDMGPGALAAEAEALALRHGADVTIVTGDELASGYPLVDAVGRAAEDPPRFVEISWGDANAPRVAIVGKGVSFDTGGLNLKTGDGMGLMKKDMGGAAHALALARLVMEAALPVRLSVFLPIVENAIGAGAFRPGDILPSRAGLTIEIDNTDAEGRLILADALTRACEGAPELLIDFATLTGAARVALGPDLAPMYTDDAALAEAISQGGAAWADPVWRMPLWRNYESQLKSPIADMKNTGDGPMAGSITAALFLKRFVSAPSWVHFDVWAWRGARYGRPAGAAACGLRAVWAMLQARYR